VPGSCHCACRISLRKRAAREVNAADVDPSGVNSPDDAERSQEMPCLNQRRRPEWSRSGESVECAWHTPCFVGKNGDRCLWNMDELEWHMPWMMLWGSIAWTLITLALIWAILGAEQEIA